MHTLNNEQTNRIILVLAIVLALAIFMDFQARRHYTSQLGFDGDTSSLTSEHAKVVTSSIQKPLKTSLNSILGETRKIISEKINTKEIIDIQKLQYTKKATKAKVSDYFQQNLDNPGGIRKAQLHAEISPVPRTVLLYFIQFKHGHSELVNVKRIVSQNRLTYYHVIEMLQHGPTLRERSLINAFSNKIHVNSLKLHGNNLVVDLSKAINFMGAHVIKDRLDQLTWTLTQFPEIETISLLVDGEPLRQVGKTKIPLPSHLKRTNRKVSKFQK